MNNMISSLVLTSAILLLGIAAQPVSRAAEPQPKPDVSPAAPADRDLCLQCHGPFEALAGSAKKFTVPESGEEINPHQYVPHNRKIEKNVPPCTKCHKPHPVPPTSKKDVPQAGVQWCYTCHHTEEFKACGSCHN